MECTGTSFSEFCLKHYINMVKTLRVDKLTLHTETCINRDVSKAHILRQESIKMNSCLNEGNALLECIFCLLTCCTSNIYTVYL